MLSPSLRLNRTARTDSLDGGTRAARGLAPAAGAARCAGGLPGKAGIHRAGRGRGLCGMPAVLPAPSLQRELADSVCRHLPQAPKSRAWHLRHGYPRPTWGAASLHSWLQSCSLLFLPLGCISESLPAVQFGHEGLRAPKSPSMSPPVHPAAPKLPFAGCPITVHIRCRGLSGMGMLSPCRQQVESPGLGAGPSPAWEEDGHGV